MKLFDLPEFLLSIIIYDYLDSFNTLKQLEIALNNKKLYNKLYDIYKNSKKFSLSLLFIKKNNNLYIETIYNKFNEKENYFFSNHSNNDYDSEINLSNQIIPSDISKNPILDYYESPITSPESTSPSFSSTSSCNVNTSPSLNCTQSLTSVVAADPLLTWIINRNISIKELIFQDAPINNSLSNILIIKLLKIVQNQMKLVIPYSKWSLKFINNLGKRLENLEISSLNNWNNYIPLTSNSSTLYYSSNLDENNNSTSISVSSGLKLIEILFILTNCPNIKTLTILTNNGIPIIDSPINFVTYFKVYTDFQEFNYNKILEIEEEENKNKFVKYNLKNNDEEDFYKTNYIDKVKIINEDLLNYTNIESTIKKYHLSHVFAYQKSAEFNLPMIKFKHTSLLNLCYVSPIVPNESFSKLINFCENIERIIGMSALNSIKNKNFLLTVNKNSIKNLKHFIFFSYSSLSTKILNKILIQAKKIETLEIEKVHYSISKQLYTILSSSSFNTIPNLINLNESSSDDEEEDNFDDIFNNDSSTFSVPNNHYSSSSIRSKFGINFDSDNEEDLESSNSTSNETKELLNQDIFYNLMKNSTNLETLSLRNGVIITSNNLYYFYNICKNLHTLQIGVKYELFDTKKNYLFHLFQTVLTNKIKILSIKNSIYLTNRILRLIGISNINLVRLEFISCNFINFSGIKELTKIKNLKLILCIKCKNVTLEKFNYLINLNTKNQQKVDQNQVNLKYNDNEDLDETFNMDEVDYLSEYEVNIIKKILIIIER